jgi:hypothetical protein
LKVIHSDWNDGNLFAKMMCDKGIVEDEGQGNYKLTCINLKDFVRLIEYDMNIKLIDPGAHFKVNFLPDVDKYKLEILVVVNDNCRSLMKSSQAVINIMIKKTPFKIIKSTDNNYTLEEGKITYTLNDFCGVQKILIGVLFETSEKDFVEVVKVMYRYMVN